MSTQRQAATMKAADECVAILRRLAPNERAYAIAVAMADLLEDDSAIVEKVGHVLLRGMHPHPTVGS